jgi:hypothetical protein
LTGSQLDGTVAPGDADSTCNNWTSSGDGSALLGHHDRQGGGDNPTSWNSAHGSRGCSQSDLQGTGGDGLFYCFAAVLIGDFNGDGLLDIVDLDRLTSEIQAGATATHFDLDQSGAVDLADRQFWVTDVKLTWIGDANLDREVNFDDFVALSNNFGQPGGWERGDFDGNGQIEFADFVALSANFGVAANASAAAVPEPSGATLALFGIGLIGFRKRR